MSLQWRRERPQAGESARLVADGYEITRVPLGFWTTWLVDESLPHGRRAIAGGMVKPQTAKQAADASSMTVRRCPPDDDEPCERCGLIEACMCGEPRHDINPLDLL